ncbi:hypothetical protein SDJN02_07453, partial [Cucurbita argyrosperma subsp. argyrosperma]
VLQPYNNGDRNFLLSSALAANVRRRHFSLAALPYDHGRVACLISCEATALCSFNFVDNRVCPSSELLAPIAELLLLHFRFFGTFKMETEASSVHQRSLHFR